MIKRLERWKILLNKYMADIRPDRRLTTCQSESKSVVSRRPSVFQNVTLLASSDNVKLYPLDGINFFHCIIWWTENKVFNTFTYCFSQPVRLPENLSTVKNRRPAGCNALQHLRLKLRMTACVYETVLLFSCWRKYSQFRTHCVHPVIEASSF
jgi:hypothetical protein